MREDVRSLPQPNVREYEVQDTFLLHYLRALQGHSGDITIEPELMGYVSILRNWKRSIFHRTFMELSVHIGKRTDSKRKGEG